MNKKIVIIGAILLASNIALAEMIPLAPSIDSLPHELVPVLFEKINKNEKIEIHLLHQALNGPQTALRANAARILGEQGDETSIPYLIDALSDESMHVGGTYINAGMATTRYWAKESLKKLTGEDFGFVWDDPKGKRIRSIIRWREWYLKKYKKKT
jgi:HEAT repeat protein